MHITHQHPSCSVDGPQELADLQALYRTCLLALRRYRQIHASAPPGIVRIR